MPKPGGDPSSGISLGDVLRRPKRHPACRRREAQPGSCTERENLIGDAKGKGASGSNREAESTDAPGRRGRFPDQTVSRPGHAGRCGDGERDRKRREVEKAVVNLNALFETLSSREREVMV